MNPRTEIVHEAVRETLLTNVNLLKAIINEGKRSS